MAYPKEMAGEAAGAGVRGFLGAVPIVGGVLGGLKSLFDFGRAKRQANIQAATTAYSPWTHMQGKEPDAVNPIGDVAQGAASGLGLAQNIQNQQRMNVWDDLLKSRFAEMPNAYEPSENIQGILNRNTPYRAKGFTYGE